MRIIHFYFPGTYLNNILTNNKIIYCWFYGKIVFITNISKIIYKIKDTCT